MQTIKLRSKKELFFPPFHKGTVEMEITSIIMDRQLKKYTLFIRDTCFIEVDEEVTKPVYPDDFDFADRSEENMAKINYVKETIKVKKILGTPHDRESNQSSEDISNLVKAIQKLNPNVKKLDLDKAMDVAFGQGLLHVTKKEIEEENLKWYQCDSIEDWELIIE